MVAMHHPLPTVKRNECPRGRWRDIFHLLEAHPNVKLVLSGQYHVRGAGGVVGGGGGILFFTPPHRDT